MLSPDTLIISIGSGNGFVNEGFNIHYFDSSFYTKPYYSDDIVFPDERDPNYKILYQRLILDKPKYKNGDSLFGRIEFKSIGLDMFHQKSEQFGMGNFRAKVDNR